MKLSTCTLIALLILGAACKDEPLGPQVAGPSSNLSENDVPDAAERIAGGVAGNVRDISVLTQNLYVGADVDAVIGALVSPDPTDDVPALLAAIQTFQETDYQARLGGVADAIARNRPHAVGLQEVSVLDIDLSALGVPTVIHADFLPVLEQALRQRGLNYQVAAKVKNIEATPVPGVRLVDYDVLLVDAERVALGQAGGQNFSTNLGTVAPGVELKRGWVWAGVHIGGRPYFIASTHLEGSATGMPELLAAQAAELARFLPTELPVVVMGDFNDQPGSPMHRAMTEAGFGDLWAEWRPGAAGFTCCHASDLSDGVAQFSQRIDYVFARAAQDGPPRLLGSIHILGDTPDDRIQGPLHLIWPSDHGGLAVRILGPHRQSD